MAQSLCSGGGAQPIQNVVGVLSWYGSLISWISSLGVVSSLKQKKNSLVGSEEMCGFRARLCGPIAGCKPRLSKKMLKIYVASFLSMVSTSSSCSVLSLQDRMRTYKVIYETVTTV